MLLSAKLPVARKLTSAREQILWSRSARDLIRLSAENPELAQELASERPLLSQIQMGRRTLEVALDSERREFSIINEHRLEKYALAAREWSRNWPELKAAVAGLPLKQAHRIVVEHAQILPQQVL